MGQHHEETHITVDGDPIRWHRWCLSHGIKPLWIELNTFQRQLMCAIKTHGPESVAWWQQRIVDAGFIIVRVKREIQPYKLDITVHSDTEKRYLDVPTPAEAIYYECHAKFDGPFRPSWHMASRDLYRENRWYVTTRRSRPFDPQEWLDTVAGWARVADGWRDVSVLVGSEYEAAVLDTNPELDARWSSFAR